MSADREDELRARLRALQAPAPAPALRERVLHDAPASGARPWWQPVWRPALAAAVVLAVSAFGVREYLVWQELQLLAELDTLSAATMLLL